MLQFTFTFRAMKFFLHIYMYTYPFILSCCWSSSRTIPCISKLSPCQAAYHFLAVYQNGKLVPAYSDSPSIDTLEFAKALSSEAKALSSEVKNESVLNHLMSTEIIRYPILLTTILTQICKSIHLHVERQPNPILTG